jgi:glycosyltransferase involved in cell wall biosynthesis
VYLSNGNVVTILIPAINEESGIRKTISSIPKVRISELGYSLEIIVIDGNSSDLTREVAQYLGTKVIVEKRKGYGRAYKTGLAMATGNIIVTLDADGTYPAELIPEYIEQLNKKYLDFITINRFSQIDDGAMSILHIVGNKILSSVMRLLYSINIQDSQSGMWIMKKSFVDRIILNSDDMSLSEEIKIIAFKFFKSLELDGKYSNRFGTAKLNTIGHGWTNLKYLFQYRNRLKVAILPLRTLEPEIS